MVRDENEVTPFCAFRRGASLVQIRRNCLRRKTFPVLQLLLRLRRGRGRPGWSVCRGRGGLALRSGVHNGGFLFLAWRHHRRVALARRHIDLGIARGECDREGRAEYGVFHKIGLVETVAPYRLDDAVPDSLPSSSTDV